MSERPVPPVTVSVPGRSRAAEVLAAGRDEPGPSRWRTAAGVALAAALLGGAALSRADDGGPSPQVPEQADLALVETGGVLSMHWGYGGRLDVSLPLLLRNSGGPMTISSVALEGTSLVQPAVDVPVVPGGQLPLTLRQAMTCPQGAAVPPDAALRLEVRRDGRGETRVLALPDGMVQSLTEGLLVQCSSLPIEQAVVLQVEEVEQRGDVVRLRVTADNVGTDGLRLQSVDPATGFSVTPSSDASSTTAGLPAALSQQPVVFGLEVGVVDCAAIPPAAKLATAGIADVGYDDGHGQRAAESVAGDLPLLRALVERRC